jgi:hypothetical protein
MITYSLPAAYPKNSHGRSAAKDLLANLRVLLEKRMLEIDDPGDIASVLSAEFLRWGQRSEHDDLIFAIAPASGKPAANQSPNTSPAPPHVPGCTPLIGANFSLRGTSVPPLAAYCG